MDNALSSKIAAEENTAQTFELYINRDIGFEILNSLGFVRAEVVTNSFGSVVNGIR